MEANREKGNAVRAEHEIYQQQLHAQREMFKERGRKLRAQRLRGELNEKTQQEACKQRNLEEGNNIRTKREVWRAKRESNDNSWKGYGRSLGEQQAMLQNKLKIDAEARRVENSASASQLKADLKTLNQSVDDSIYKQKCASAARIKYETSEEAMRRSKMSFINDRWDKADELREKMDMLREERKRNEHEYQAYASLMKVQAQQRSNAEADRQRREAEKRAMEMRTLEKEWKDTMQQARRDTLDYKRRVHESTETDKHVSEAELMDVDGTLGTLGAAFSRFFGFRKRGTGNTSSVTL